MSELRYLRGEYMSAVGCGVVNESGSGSEGEGRRNAAFTEHVALGFRLVDVLEGMGLAVHGVAAETLSAVIGMTVEGETVWIDLKNSHPSPSADFTVQGEEVRRAIEDAGCAPYVLWHSHFSKVGPSTEDELNFPAWLVSVGAVFTVQRGVTMAYGKTVGIYALSNTELEDPRHG